MPTLTKKVFLSSTLIDLKEYRAAAVHACQRVGLIPIYMEDFPPDPRDAVAVCLAKVDEADLFLGVYAHRYGYVPEGSDISITEMEYDRAIERGLPVHLFVMDLDHPWPPSKVDKGKDYEGLERFKSKIGKRHVWKKFGEVASFQDDVLLLLYRLAQEKPQEPAETAAERQARKRTLPSPPEMHSVPPYILTNRFVGRRQELEGLDAWGRAVDPMLVVEAIGGMGKSALTWEWAQERARHAIPGLAGILWWSFYEGGASTASFVREALAYVAGEDPEALRSVPAPEQAERLLAELRRRPCLLVLDGFERLLTAYHQLDPSKLRDEEVQPDLRSCTDPKTEDLLRQLAACAPSKVLVTTRLMPSALENKAHQPIQGVQHRELRGLTPEDGERLLRELGVTHGDSGAIRRFLRKFDNHSLLIGVLSGRIRDYRFGPGNFDRWLADPQEGGSLRLSKLKLEQRRTHILAYAFAGLDPVKKQLLSRIAVLSDAADFATVAALNPYLPPRPEEVPEPEDPDAQYDFELTRLRWDLEESPGKKRRSELERKISDRRAEMREEYERQSRVYQSYLEALQSYFESAKYRAAVAGLDEALKDLEERGLLQWDRASNSYDLHPVVRGYAFDQLEGPDRVQTYERIRDHFEKLPPENLEEATELSQVRNTVQIYLALLGSGQIDRAAQFYHSQLSFPLSYSIAAYGTAVELITPLFSKGLYNLPTITDTVLQAYLSRHLASALSYLGRREEAVRIHLLQIKTALEAQSWKALALTIFDYAIVLDDLGRLADSSCMEELGHERARSLADDTVSARSLYVLTMNRIRKDQWRDAEAAYREYASNSASAVNQPGDGNMEMFLCWLRFWKGSLREQDLEEALAIATQAKNPYAQEWLHTLRAEVAIQENDPSNAIQAAERAIEISKRRDAPNPRAQGSLAHALALQHRYNEARALVEEAAVSLHHAAEVYLEIGDSEKAKEYGLRAYKHAWADGPPHIRWWELERSKRVLARLGVPEPELPPFDPSKVEPIPFGAEIRAVIEKLKTEKEGRERQA